MASRSPSLKDSVKGPLDSAPDAGSLSGGNAPFLEGMFEDWKADPSSVSEQWQSYFIEVENEKKPSVQVKRAGGQKTFTLGEEGALNFDVSAWEKQNSVSQMISAYRTYGHKWAHINPISSSPDLGDDLSLARFNLSESDLDTSFATDGVLPYDTASLRDIVAALKKTYVGTIGVQYRDLPTGVERRWLKTRMESIHNKPTYSKEQKLRFYDGLYRAAAFENFLHKKYMGMKRFSVEGGDSLIPMLQTLIDLAGDHGVADIVLGMAHRGRLNVLTNIMGKPLEEMIAAFENTLEVEGDAGGSDVKYHFGRSADVLTEKGHQLHLSLLNNPSHLEAINPVVEGSVRAKQRRFETDGEKKVFPLLIHGDSAFCGQGIVPETLNLAELDGYHTGGTVHIVINNRLGYTAEPHEVFSGEYCTDIARMLQVPIFHVNGDDVEACVHVMELAMAWRQAFQRDVVIDLVCYRKYGHNEGDDPTFTQPVEYVDIKRHPTPADIYKKETLEKDERISEADIDGVERTYVEALQNAYDMVKKKGVRVRPDVFAGVWEDFSNIAEKEPATAISQSVLNAVAESITNWEGGFTPHPKIKKLMEQRQAMLRGEENLNWGAGEVTAYASLLNEGYSLRLTGQDVQRGTFAHRHISMVDYENGRRMIPIAALASGGARAEVHNSSLSELAVLGFEYGYTLADPKTLTIWEAQFGDFSNGAQIIIDQFLSSSETKWNRYSGLVMLLPHGYEGQGPEHSSARPERYLQLCAENNMTIANVTTPAQMFHLLRRQMLRTIRRPLIVLTPKSLLRHPKAVSPAKDLVNGGFEEVIADNKISSKNIKRVVLCTGREYYDLVAAMEKQERTDVALIRLEQLYPLPLKKIQKILSKAPKKAEVCWVQEEPRNQGYWTYLLDNLVPHLGVPVRYIGRDAAASPAVGSPKRHAQEQQAIVDAVFD